MIRSLCITLTLISSLSATTIAHAYDEELNPLFQHLLNGEIEQLSQMEPIDLQLADYNGFTLLDYARINHDQATIEWVEDHQIRSGINKSLIQRIQLWFYFLGVPVSNMDGIYNEAFAQDILNFQQTRGYQTNRYITPDWFSDLEEEAILSLQTRLNQLNIETPLSGELDRHTLNSLKKIAIDKNAPLISKTTLSYLKNDDSYTPHLARFLEKQQQIDYANSVAKELEELYDSEQKKEEEKSSTLADADSTTELTNEEQTEEIAQEKESIFDFSREEIDEILIGARSGNVLTVQTWLKLAGFFPHNLDGDMGPITREAIKRYQRSIDQKETGQLHPSWERVLEKEIRKMTQAELKRLGLYHSDVDGIDGISTRGAIESFERSQKIEETGSLSPHLLLVLFNQLDMDHLPKPKVEYASAADETITTSDASREIRLYHSPQRKTLTRTQLIGGYNLTGNEQVALQQLMLAYLGYYDAIIDGITGTQAREATKTFQRRHKLSEDGVIGGKTYQILRRETINKFQRYLNESGYMDDEPTGTLGPKTRSAVVKLKEAHNFKELDHSLDVALLLILIDKEQHSNYHQEYQRYLVDMKKEEAFITELQKNLIAFGFLNSKADGIDGPATQKALQKFRTTYKVDKKIGNDHEILAQFEKHSVRKGQEYLKALKHKIKVDGVWGKNTQEEMNKFLAKNKMDQSDAFNADILIAMKEAIDTHQKRVNRRAPSKAAAAPATQSKGTRVSMANISSKGQQTEGMLSAAPKNRVSGRLELIRNNSGSVVGCRVNNISMGMRWCENQKNGSQCSIFYHNGRVLSLRCR